MVWKSWDPRNFNQVGELDQVQSLLIQYISAASSCKSFYLVISFCSVQRSSRAAEKEKARQMWHSRDKVLLRRHLPARKRPNWSTKPCAFGDRNRFILYLKKEIKSSAKILNEHKLPTNSGRILRFPQLTSFSCLIFLEDGQV